MPAARPSRVLPLMRFDRAGFPFVGGAWLIARDRGRLRLVLAGAAVVRPRRVLRCSSSAIPNACRPMTRTSCSRRPTGASSSSAPPSPASLRQAQWQQISIFLSPMDVHVNRIPASGTVTSVSYTPGKFLPAYRHEAAAVNERSEVWIDHGNGADGRRASGGRDARAPRRLPRHVGAARARGTAVRHHEVRLAHGRVPAASARRSVHVGDMVRGGETVIAVLD